MHTRKILLPIVTTALTVSVLLSVDVLTVAPVEATVVTTDDSAHPIRATVEWVDDQGTTQTATVALPDEYETRETVPVIDNGLISPYVGEEWFPATWYVVAALAGLAIGGPVARSLKPKNYEREQPIRMTGTGMGQ